jgi:hypothetical protein
MEEDNKREKLVTVKFYLTKVEAFNAQAIADRLYEYKIIPRPSLGAFSKASFSSFVNWFIHSLAASKGEASASR